MNSDVPSSELELTQDGSSNNESNESSQAMSSVKSKIEWDQLNQTKPISRTQSDQSNIFTDRNNQSLKQAINQSNNLCNQASTRANTQRTNPSKQATEQTNKRKH